MATPWKNIEAAFWTFLEAESTFTALSLTKYKGYDGNFYPFDVEQDAPSTQKLPCIIGRLAGVQPRGPLCCASPARRRSLTSSQGIH